jgi:hypothetical protein
MTSPLDPHFRDFACVIAPHIAIMCCLAFLALFICFLPISQAQSPITLLPVQGTAFLHPTGIGYHEPSGTLLLSEYFSNGLPYNFDRILFDGTHVQFTNISGMQDEIYFASVRSSYTYSIAQGFQFGDMFTGNGVGGQVMRIRTDANGNNPVITNPWVVLPPPPSGKALGYIRGGLCFDETGIYNGDLIVAVDGGQVYRVNASAHATFIGDVSVVNPNVGLLEGVIVLPNDTTLFGPYAGYVMGGGKYLWTLAPGVTPKQWMSATALSGGNNNEFENFNIAIPYTNFFGVDQAGGEIVASLWQDWQPYWNNVIMCTEWPPNSGSSGIFVVTYNSSISNFTLTEIPLTSGSRRPSDFEGATFAQAGVNDIPPAVNVCFVGFWEGQSYTALPYQLAPGPSTPAPFYGYNTTAPLSPDPHTSTPNVPRPQNGSIVFYWSLTYFNVLFLTILVNAPNSGIAGSAQLELATVNLQNTAITFIQLDDSPSLPPGLDYPDTYYWDSSQGTGLFQWKWGPTTSDGVILGPFPLYQSYSYIQQGYCVKPRLLSSNGISTAMYLANFVNNNTDYILLGPDPEICVYLCPQFCFLYGTCSDCIKNPQCIWCSSSQSCMNVNSTTQTCPVNETLTSCPCSTYTALGCSSCTALSGCEWCCENNMGTCIQAGGQCGGTTYNNQTCLNSTTCAITCQNGGQCVCGQCQCPSGFYGADCSETKDCHGVINGTATLDVCGVCGGNGTECLGCDGQPYGINFTDACGVCGGNGMECYHPCNATNCTACLLNSELCSWCPVEQRCIYFRGNETCLYANESKLGVQTCASPVLTPAAIAGLSAGIIAAIVIAVVVILAVAAGVGGRMIYVRHRKTDAPQDIVLNNPVYENKTTQSENPLYVAQVSNT